MHGAVYLLSVLLLLTKHFQNGIPGFIYFVHFKRAAYHIAQGDVQRHLGDLLPVGVHNFHGRVNEQHRLFRGERKFPGNIRPVGDEQV